MAAQLDRQVSGNEFSGLVSRPRPFSDTHRPESAGTKLTKKSGANNCMNFSGTQSLSE